MDTIPEEIIRRDLGENEKLLWCGQPRQGLLLRSSDAVFIPFSLLWGGFAIFWEASAISMNAPAFFCLWGLPFVVIGLYLIVGRFWADAWQRKSTLYAVTSQRVLIVSGLFSKQTKSLDISALADISLTERSNGFGSITFGNLPFGYWRDFYAGHAVFGHPSVPQFDLIADARSVYDTIRIAQKASRTTNEKR